MINQEQGLEIKVIRNAPVIIPLELQKLMDSDKGFKAVFEKLSVGKQRDYAEHISNAKRTETKQKRLDKIVPLIMDGKGLNDKYKK